jgi:hypothetical protein
VNGTWTDAGAPRIWRSPQSDFNGDETMRAADIYTDAELTYSTNASPIPSADGLFPGAGAGAGSSSNHAYS